MMFIIPVIAFAGIPIPTNNFHKDWQTSGSTQKFTKEDLYGHINGGAELFLEFGFDTLFVQHYVNRGNTLTLEIYQMEDSLSAIGIYLMKCGKENPVKDIAGRHTANRYQLTLVRNKYFIQINNFSGNESHREAMSDLANKLLSPITESHSSPIWKWLPTKHRIPGSELLIRGPYGLQSIYTFGEDDILGLRGKYYALIADYKTPDQGSYTWIKVNYKNAAIAHNSFLILKNGLDPLLSIINKQNDSFTFIDYANEYGLVKYDQNFLSIKIHLKSSAYH